MKERMEFSEYKQEAEVSPEEASFVRFIENIPVSDDTKVQFLLMYKGYRTNANDIVGDGLGDWRIRSLGKKNKELEAMGYTTYLQPDSKGFHHYVVADPRLREKLPIVDAADPKERRKQVIFRDGLSYGFPRTAIEAFVSAPGSNLGFGDYPDNTVFDPFEGKYLPADYDPQEYLTQDFMAFVGYKPSRVHWKEEFEETKQHAAEIKLLDKDLYDRMVTDYYQGMPRAKKGVAAEKHRE